MHFLKRFPRLSLQASRVHKTWVSASRMALLRSVLGDSAKLCFFYPQVALAPDTGIRLLHGPEACRPGKIVSPPWVNGGAFHLEGCDAQTTAL